MRSRPSALATALTCAALAAGALALGAVDATRAWAAGADGTTSASMQANPDILMADGRSQTTITVTLDDGEGHAVPDGTQVHFSATNGTLNPTVALASGGVARTSLTSAPIAGSSTVTASFIGAAGGGTGSVMVEFTNDSDLADTDQVSANWIRVISPGYLAYSAETKTIDAATHKHGVRITYRGTAIEADSAQVDLDGDVVRAQNAVLEHGSRPPLHVDSLIYYLDAHQGDAVIANAPGMRHLEQVGVDGATLKATELTDKQLAGVKSSDYEFEDLSLGHVLITASAIGVQPHQQIQLSRATIYVDGKKLIAMPNQVMPLTTNQLFGKQVVGYGTSGLFLDVPYYQTLTPTTTGMFSLRSTAAAQQSGTFYSGRQALALDYDRSYTLGSRQGDFKVIGMSSSDWGMRWSQSQRLAGNTQTYFYIDSPLHRSLYGTGNMRHDFGPVALNIDASSTQPLIGNSVAAGHSLAANLSTPTHVLTGTRRHGIVYAEQATYDSTYERYRFGSHTAVDSLVTHSFGVRMNTSPFQPSRLTTVTDSFTVEQSTSDTTHYTALNMTGSVQANSQLSRTVNANFSYNWTHDPRFSPAVPVVVGANIIGLADATDQHNFTLTLGAGAPTSLWSATLASTYGLPTGDMTVSSGLTYRVSSQMHLGLSNYYSAISGYAYRDYDLSISHRLGERDVVVSWSAIMHRWEVNLAQLQF